MKRERELQLDAFAVDVRDLLDRSVANLYSHLVTRPTGRAVRLAIETQLRELELPALSLVDLSSVSILDYSCADEVVAKLLLGRTTEGRAASLFYVFRGLREHHREPILEVLDRHGLATVARGEAGTRYELLGVHSRAEAEVWSIVEEAGTLPARELPDRFGTEEARRIARGLAARGLLFRHPLKGDLHALSTLVPDDR